MKKALATGILALVLLTGMSITTAPQADAIVLFPKLNKAVGRTFNVKHGSVTAINGTSLTVQTNNGVITVLTDSNTKFRRHFWGDSLLSEISIGDWVNVKGTYTDDARTSLQATYVRDVSIAIRFGTFIGNVISKTDSSFVVNPDQRGDQTVFFDSSTKFVDKNGSATSYSSINTGDKVRVKGMWDKKLHKITQVREVKDFSQPAGSTSPTPTP